MIGMKRKRNAFWAFLISTAILLAACSPAGGVEPAIGNNDSAVSFAEEQVEELTPPETEDEDESSTEEAVEAEDVEETPTVAPTDVEVSAGDESDVDESNDEADDVETGVADENADEPAVESQATQTPEAMDEDTVFQTDDRLDNLRFVTEGWNTNWQRHSIEYEELLSGGPSRDGIRSLDDPTFVSLEEAAEWLVGNEPVIALEIDGDARAYPLQILTWHEIANDVVGEVPVIVTFCPLCNSALVFDRRLDGETYEFGTSGLLRNSDLVMYDRTTESLWQQFTGEGIAGDLTGEQLTFLASSLVSFDNFKDAFPEGVVLSQDTGFERAYGINPYGGYDTYENPLSAGGSIALLQARSKTAVYPRLKELSLCPWPDAGVDVAYPLSVSCQKNSVDKRFSRAGKIWRSSSQPGTSSALGGQIIAFAEDVGATGVFDANLDGQITDVQPRRRVR